MLDPVIMFHQLPTLKKVMSNVETRFLKRVAMEFELICNIINIQVSYKLAINVRQSRDLFCFMTTKLCNKKCKDFQSRKRIIEYFLQACITFKGYVVQHYVKYALYHVGHTF